MDAFGRESRDVVALRPEDQQATSSCLDYVTAHIELSKRHWSELSESLGDGISREEVANAKLDNCEVFKEWELHPKWGRFFFATFGDHSEVWPSVGSLEVGEKFAEGAQAELFHARVKWSNPKGTEWDLENGAEYVLKVFKEGSLVRDLQHQWQEGMFRIPEESLELRGEGKHEYKSLCEICCATLLEDGRFAFLMVKEDGDLRSLIERKMAEIDHGCGPFSVEVGEEIMYHIALGMDELHKHNIVHRDLKASNVLVKTDASGKSHRCYVADYESSVGVVGTGFWRAPEILRALREKNIGKRLELFSKEADSYSYGMTCYEVLTGTVPFEDHPLSEQHSLLTDLVIDQDLRPEVPEYVEDWVKELLQWCWKPASEERPSFKEILGFLEANSNSEYIQWKKEVGVEYIKGEAPRRHAV